MDWIIIPTLFFAACAVVAFVIYLFVVAWSDHYPADVNKYRIKEKILKRGVSYYYVQYKWWFFWRTYKVVKQNDLYGNPYNRENWCTFDVYIAKAKITELIADRQRIDGEKTDKIEYHYYNNVKGHFGDQEY